MAHKEYFNELVSIYNDYHHKPKINLIKKSYELAKIAYYDEYRLNNEPWIDYVLKLAITVAKLKVDTATICGAILYDSYKFGLSIDEIKNEINEDTARIVKSVDDLRELSLKHNVDISEKVNADVLRRLVLLVGRDLRVVLLRISEKLLELDLVNFLEDPARKNILNNAIHIYAPLSDLIGVYELKWQIEEKYFQITEPELYKKCKSILYKHPLTKKSKMKKLLRDIKLGLSEGGVDYSRIFWRTKKIYSFYDKILRKSKKYDLDFESAVDYVDDVVAVSIIVNTVEDCYKTLDVLTQQFDFLSNRFDDYISNPKPNGYRGLHTIIVIEGNKVEIQIKTQEMYEFNEYGPASHVFYKLQDSTSQNSVNIRMDILKKLLFWRNQILDDIKKTSTDELDDSILVLTPKGDIIELPKDSTPIDFAYAVHTDIGNKAVNVLVDGVQKPLNYRLSNGQVVKILIDKRRKKPNVEWLKFVKTRKARFEIKKHGLRKVYLEVL